MCKRAFWSKLTWFSHFPISAHFRFKFLLKITLCGTNCSGLYCFDFLWCHISAIWGLVKFVSIIIFMIINLWSPIMRVVVAVPGKSVKTVIVVSGALDVTIAYLACSVLIGRWHWCMIMMFSFWYQQISWKVQMRNLVIARVVIIMECWCIEIIFLIIIHTVSHFRIIQIHQLTLFVILDWIVD